MASVATIVKRERLTLRMGKGVVWKPHEETGYIRGLEHLGSLSGLVTDGMILWVKTKDGKYLDVHLDNFANVHADRPLSPRLYMPAPTAAKKNFERHKARLAEKKRLGFCSEDLA